MDLIYSALVYLSMLIYLELPFFWLVRHYIFLNFGHKIEFKALTYLIIAFLELAVFFVLSPYVSVKNELPSYAAPFGFLVLIAWIILEGWSHYLLFASIKSFRKLETELVTHGPFGVIRHPLYAAHILFNFGAYLVTGALIPLAVLVEWLILVKPLADLEDEELMLRMEEKYQEYRKKVPQLIPKMR